MKKGVVLVIVIGVMMIVFTLALVVLYLRTQESRIAEHKIKRTRGIFAARAGMVHALEEIRKGNDPSGLAVLNLGSGGSGSGYDGYPSAGIAVDVVYESTDTSGPGGTRPVTVMANY